MSGSIEMSFDEDRDLEIDRELLSGLRVRVVRLWRNGVVVDVGVGVVPSLEISCDIRKLTFRGTPAAGCGCAYVMDVFTITEINKF